MEMWLLLLIFPPSSGDDFQKWRIPMYSAAYASGTEKQKWRIVRTQGLKAMEIETVMTIADRMTAEVREDHNGNGRPTYTCTSPAHLTASMYHL